MSVITLKATAIANSNTALIKYWGKKDEELIIPMNNSISITTDALNTKTTVEFSDDYKEDTFVLDGKIQSGKSYERVVKHLDLIRKRVNDKRKANVCSENNFPTAAGLASSASGFAALTVAACEALDLNLNEKELSMLSRQGSGSSCRSIFGGYVEWIKEDENKDSYSIQLAEKDWFDVRDIIVVFETKERKWSTREAMSISKNTSPFFHPRLKIVEENLEKIRRAIKDKDFTTLGTIAEQDCLMMHSVALTSIPSQLFWTKETLAIIDFVEKIRQENLEAYYTIDTGANMHILVEPENAENIQNRLLKMDFVKKSIISKPGDGTKIISDHLF